MDIYKKNMNIIINLCMMPFIFAFPLVYRDYYADILQFKYQCYYVAVILMGILIIISTAIMCMLGIIQLRDLLPHNRTANKAFFLQDGALLCFLCIAMISTLQSDYLFESFWGNEGRYSGLFLLMIYSVNYFIITRLWIWNRWWIDLFLIGGILMCLIGIANYFSFDVLNFVEGMDGASRVYFVSTIGNINTYTAYISLLIGVSTALFVFENNRRREGAYFICMTVSFFAIILADSDSGYLAIGSLFCFLPYCILHDKRQTVKYLIAMTLLLTIFPCIGYLNIFFSDTVRGLNSLFNVIVSSNILFIIILTLWISTIGLLLSYKKKRNWSIDFSHKLKWLWTLILVCGLIIVTMIFVDINLLGNYERYKLLGNYFQFDDSWGTNRGYIWRKSIELYRDFSLPHKIFGYGPDTVGILATLEIKEEVLKNLHQIFDNVHNEYLQYFITIGPVGLASYLIFLISTIYLMLAKKNAPIIIKACAFGTLCYSCQAFVNLSVPIVAPMFWLLLSIGMAIARNSDMVGP